MMIFDFNVKLAEASSNELLSRIWKKKAMMLEKRMSEIEV